MIDPEIQQAIDGNKMEGLIPYHIHNGIDSPKIPPSSIVGLPLLVAVSKMILSPTQVKALHTTPVTLVPAQGATTVVIVDGITARVNFNSAAYTGANNLEFRYTDGSGTKVTADMGSAFLDSASMAYQHVAGIITAFAPIANAPIVVCVPAANPAAGNSTITFITKYRIIPF